MRGVPGAGFLPSGRPTSAPLAAAVLVLVGVGAACTLVGVPPRAPEAGPGEAARRGGGTEGGGVAAPPTGRESAPEPVRALWVVRTSLVHPDSVRAMVRRADRAGFNALLVQVRGRGDAYYGASREPRADVLAARPPGYDPLALVLREAHARGIAVHAWVNVHLVHGVGRLVDDPDHLVRAHPEWLAVPRDLAPELRRIDPGDPRYVRELLGWARRNDGSVEGLFTSPAHPRVKEHVHDVLVDLVERYPVDGLHLDYVRYPSPDFDYSPVALERFRLWMAPRLAASRAAELDRRRVGDPFAWIDAFPDAWDDFRRAQITDVVRRTYHAAKELRPRIVVTAAVRPDPDEAREARFQDWAAWLDEGILDAAAPMAYTEDVELFRSWMDGALRRADPGRIWAGVGLYKTDLQGALLQVAVARSRDVRGVAVFSYDWAVNGPTAERPGPELLERLGREAFGGAVGAR